MASKDEIRVPVRSLDRWPLFEGTYSVEGATFLLEHDHAELANQLGKDAVLVLTKILYQSEPSTWTHSIDRIVIPWKLGEE